MQDLVQILITGVTLGSVFALIALGYTLVYGIIELINFAHGDLFMLASFVALTVLDALDIGLRDPAGNKVVGMLGALLAAMVFGAVVNVVIERLAYRRLRNAPRLAPLISALGMSFILIQIGQSWKGSAAVSFPRPVANQNLLGDLGIRFGLRDLLTIIVTIVLLVGLTYIVNRTRIGRAMRATAQDRDASALMGIDINRTIAFAFLLGGALAGAAGLMAGQFSGTMEFQRGFESGLKAFTAAVLGGIGNLTGAVMGGFLIGITQAVSDRYLDPRWTNTVIFGLLIITLVFRPTGILGDATTQKA